MTGSSVLLPVILVFRSIATLEVAVTVAYILEYHDMSHAFSGW